MGESNTTLKRWQAKYDSESLLHARHVIDQDLYDLEEFKLEDTYGQTVPDAYNLTSNKPKTYANRVKSALENGDLQIAVSKMDGTTDDYSAQVEEMLREVLYPLIDQYLALKGYPPLLEILSGQISLRGSIAGLVYPYQPDKEDHMNPHILPWDTMFTANGYGSDKGFSFAGVQNDRTGEEVIDEYGEFGKVPEGMDGDTDVLVTDIWTPERRETWISGSKDGKFKEQVVNGKIDAEGFDHGLGYTPVPIHKCSVNAWNRNQNYERYEGESVYESVRDLYPGYNALLSIVNTLTIRAFTNGLQFPNAGGAEAVLEGNPREDNQINAIGPLDRYYSMPLNDIQQATLMLRQILEQDIIFGSLPLMEFGDISDQETVAQITTKSAKTASVLQPRRRPIELWYDDMARLMMLQIEQRGLPHKVKLMGSVTNYTFYPLKEGYLIKHTLNIRSPQKDIANVALAQAMERYYDLETLLTDIIQADDPTGIIAKKEKEDIEKMIPSIVALREGTRRLQSEDEEEKAEGALILMESGITQDDQPPGDGAAEGVTDAAADQPPARRANLPPLFRGGGR